MKNNCPMCRGLGHLEPFLLSNLEVKTLCVLCNGKGDYKSNIITPYENNDNIKISQWNNINFEKQL
jgi:hypothetical protein